MQQRDLSLAYSPGVRALFRNSQRHQQCLQIYCKKAKFEDIRSIKPVMEGKGLLFKIFADIDVFDIEITKDIEEFIQTVKKYFANFGGINLEDIKAPESFEIERRLVEELNIL
jgi:malate dehydrogenase (oxaloacetate-decarboxylating)(NADP+)